MAARSGECSLVRSSGTSAGGDVPFNRNAWLKGPGRHRARRTPRSGPPRALRLIVGDLDRSSPCRPASPWWRLGACGTRGRRPVARGARACPRGLRAPPRTRGCWDRRVHATAPLAPAAPLCLRAAPAGAVPAMSAGGSFPGSASSAGRAPGQRVDSSGASGVIQS